MKKVNSIFFRIICFLFSAIILILSLLTSIKLAAAKDAAFNLEEKIRETKKENDVLSAAAESGMQLDELERYATEVLGMQRCAPNQIVHIDFIG